MDSDDGKQGWKLDEGKPQQAKGTKRSSKTTVGTNTAGDWQMIFSASCLGAAVVVLMSIRLLRSDFGDEVILGMLLVTFALPVMLLLMWVNWPR